MMSYGSCHGIGKPEAKNESRDNPMDVPPARRLTPGPRKPHMIYIGIPAWARTQHAAQAWKDHVPIHEARSQDCRGDNREKQRCNGRQPRIRPMDTEAEQQTTCDEPNRDRRPHVIRDDDIEALTMARNLGASGGQVTSITSPKKKGYKTSGGGARNRCNPGVKNRQGDKQHRNHERLSTQIWLRTHGATL
jgi:hypothetical protein